MANNSYDFNPLKGTGSSIINQHMVYLGEHIICIWKKHVSYNVVFYEYQVDPGVDSVYWIPMSSLSFCLANIEDNCWEGVKISYSGGGMGCQFLLHLFWCSLNRCKHLWLLFLPEKLNHSELFLSVFGNIFSLAIYLI